MNTRFFTYTTYVIFGVALLTLLHSCVPQSNYTQPEFYIPDNYRTQDSVALPQDSVGIADIDWQTFFEDEKLVALIQRGLQYNFDMQNAIKNIEISDQKLRQAKVAWLPSLSMDAGNAAIQYRSKNYYSTPSSRWYEHKGSDAPESMYINSSQYISSLALSWEIDIWGKIKSQKAEALANYLQTFEARKTVQTELISKIAEGYYNLLLLDAQMDVAQTNYELTKNTLKIVELQHEAGQVTSLAIQQTRSQMLVAKALIPSLQQQIGIQENALSLLTGQLPEAIERDARLSDLSYNEALSTGIPLYMVRRRPDVLTAELGLKAKNAAVGVTQTNRYPSLQIDLTGGVNSMLTENWFNIPGSLFGSVIGKLTQPVFNSRKLKTAFEVAKLEREQAEIDLQKTVYTAINDVTDALIVLQSLREQIDIAEEQVATSRLAIKQSNLLFNSGYASYLEIINAQKVALENELNLNKLKQHKLLARLQLYKSLGGGWK